MVSDFPVPSQDVTNQLSLAGIIPAGDRKLANLFYSVFLHSFELLPSNKVPKMLSTTSSTYRQYRGGINQLLVLISSFM